MSTARVIGRLLSPHKRFVAFIFISGLLVAAAEGAALGLLLPLVAALGDPEALRKLPIGFVVGLFEGLTPKGMVIAVGLALPLVWGVRSFLNYGNTLLCLRLGLRVNEEWTMRTFQEILAMDLLKINRDTRGNLLTMLNFNTLMASRMVQSATLQVAAVVLLLLYMAGLLLISWQLTLLGLAIAVVQSQALIPVDRMARRMGLRLRETMSSFYTGHVEGLDGQREIRLFRQEERAGSRQSEAVRRYLFAAFRAEQVNSLSSPAFGAMTMLSVGVLMITSSFFLSRLGEGWVAILMVFLVMAFRLSGSFGQLSGARTTIAGALPAVQQLLEFVDDQSKRTVRSGTRQIKTLEKGIEFADATFRYNTAEPSVLDEVSFFIPSHRVTAIVGPSGAGKSTLSDLLVRLHDPQEGRILVDGVDLRELDLGWWRAMIGVISQDTFLFNDTVHNNIAFGRPSASRGEVREAARKAAAEDFIATSPKGYETPLGDRGVRLSGGQRQRIALARALLTDPQVLILDEATSSLDSETEAAIMSSLHKFMGARTIIVIAHRLSTVRHADNIVVLDQGRVVEEGTHEALMARRGRYYALVQVQTTTEEERMPTPSEAEK